MTSRAPARSDVAGFEDLARARERVNEIIIDKEEVVELAFSALLAGGHLLI